MKEATITLSVPDELIKRADKLAREMAEAASREDLPRSLMGILRTALVIGLDQLEASRAVERR